MSQKKIQDFFSKRPKLCETTISVSNRANEVPSKYSTSRQTEDEGITPGGDRANQVLFNSSILRQTEDAGITPRGEDSDQEIFTHVIAIERRILSNNLDLGLYVNISSKNENLVRSLLTSPWIPGYNYSFPKTPPKDRSFQRSWMNRFSWLVYSDVLEGALCKYCVIFATTANRGSHNTHELGKLVRNTHKNWKKAVEDFSKHQEHEYHKMNVIMADNFLKMGVSRQSIEQQLDSHRVMVAKQNREKLVPLIESILFCGRQCIALRGHRDDSPISFELPVDNDGNFRSLLRYRAAYDEQLKGKSWTHQLMRHT